MSLHVAIVGHVAGADVAGLLDPGQGAVPTGYTGAPLMGVLVRELLQLGHRVTAITTDSALPLGSAPVRLTGPRFEFVVAAARRRAWRPNRVEAEPGGWRLGRAVDAFALERQAVRDAVQAAAPDVVHAHWTYEFALGSLDAGLPTLLTCHDAPAVVLRHTRSVYRAVRYAMAREVFRRGRHFTAVSPYLAEALQSYTPHTINVVANPVAAGVLDRMGMRGAPAARRIAMVVNGWDDRKNPKAGLMACSAFAAAEPGAEFHLFGHGFGPGQEADQWVTAQGLPGRFVFHGPCPHARLLEQVAQMDVLLHPALEESFGVVLAEAMGMGLNVVAGRHSGAVPWVLGPRPGDARAPGILVDVRSVPAIVDGLTQAFGPGYGERSALGVQRVAANFSAASVAQAYAAHYASLLAGTQAGLPARAAAGH